MDPLRVKQHNERIKVWSGIVGNLGVALFVATAGLIYTGNGSDDLFFWGFVAMLAMVAAGNMMGFLQDEG